MPTFIQCPCGQRINLGLDQDPRQYRIISEAHMMDIFERIVELHLAIPTASEADVLRFMREVIDLMARFYNPGILKACECPICGRVAVLANDNHPHVWYQIDTSVAMVGIDSLFELVTKLRASHQQAGM